jgi:hypothetical protein
MLLNFFRNRNICNQGGPHYILLMIKGTCENGPKSFPTDLQTLWGGQLVTLPTVAKEKVCTHRTAVMLWPDIPCWQGRKRS